MGGTDVDGKRPQPTSAENKIKHVSKVHFHWPQLPGQTVPYTLRESEVCGIHLSYSTSSPCCCTVIFLAVCVSHHDGWILDDDICNANCDISII
jgi:hypothetical protein